MSVLARLTLMLLLLMGSAVRAEVMLDSRPLSAAPAGAHTALHGSTVFVIGDEAAHLLRAGASEWVRLEHTLNRRVSAVASAAAGVVIALDDGAIWLATDGGSALALRALPGLDPLDDLTLAALGPRIYAMGIDRTGEARTMVLNTSRTSEGWQPIAAPASLPRSASALGVQDWVYRFGADELGQPQAVRWNLRLGWQPILPAGSDALVLAPYGHAHVLAFESGTAKVRAYHTITDRWLELATLPRPLIGSLRVAGDGSRVIVLDDAGGVDLRIRPRGTKYGWIDHGVVIVYLLGMIAVGWYFVGREKSTGDYFRGGSRIPWWATGMSLFATGASAISLMSMPGMSFSTDWSYLPQVSFLPLILLPISLFFMAPLVRRLNIATSNEYLERRFGVVARMIGSSIYIFTQVAGRMASVMLLPAIALSAITEVPIWVCVVIMGLVTTAYTFLGGLSAVVWTDTIQGFVMAFAILACLVLVILRLDPDIHAWDALASANKLHALDLEWSLVYPTLWIFVITTLLGSLGGISDQNYVQRVQCTPKLRDAQKAVAMQLGVAVPINLLLFSLGTALWLYYRARPDDLDPTMKTDGIFPFFVAQTLPTGMSGLVVAALLAATMSTISSSICSVADLGVNDFFRRFRRNATDREALNLGRVLMAVVGLLGTLAAIALNELPMRSVWDLAILVTNLISNGILGLFLLGLFTRSATEWGAIIGIACGMGAVIYLQQFTDVTFWLYGFIGSGVTFVTGYLTSAMLPREQRDLTGLTIHTLSGGAR